MDIHSIQDAALTGDRDAVTQLLVLQREGRGLRFYPDGRRGPLDEGVTPILLSVDSDRLLVLDIIKPGIELTLRPADAGRAMMFLYNVAMICRHYYMECDDPAWEIETRATEGFEVTLAINARGFSILVRSPIQNQFRLGTFAIRRIIGGWLAILAANHLTEEFIGLTMDQYIDLSNFVSCE